LDIISFYAQLLQPFEELDPPVIFTETVDEAFPVFEFPLFPPEFALESILKLILELLLWLTVQFLVLVTLTVLVEPLPFPEIMTVVPLAEGEGLADGEAVGDELGTALGELLGVGLTEGATLGLDDGLALGETDGEGLGKLAAAVKEFPKFLALSENNPKTDWLITSSTKHIKNEDKK
jgi:hypothetical protein